LLLKFLQEGIDLRAILAHLSGQKVHTKGKRFESCAMRVGDEPTGQALLSGMKLTATCGDHRMPEEQQIVTNERFSQVMKAVEILFQDEGWQTESRSTDLNHGGGSGGFTALRDAGATATVFASDCHVNRMTAFVSPCKTDGCIYRKVQKSYRLPRFLNDLAHVKLRHLKMWSEKF
jgi:hypothetical protein